jgi:receptor protein-tyrosine kinase
VRVVETARLPEAPISPNRRAILPLAAIGGLILGLALALLADTLDQSVRGEKDVEEKLKLPFLALVPHSKRRGSEKAYQTLLSEEHNFTAESFRSLRTMIGFAGMDGKAKTILVTSALAAEGKSFVSTNLAVSLATQGMDVLLIDGDLRRPSLHKVLGLSSKTGLSDFLAAGKSPEELNDLVQLTDVPKLKFLACGTRPPNPSELLNTPRTAALLGWANHHFDKVIVDTAPILPVHDTLLWARHIPSAVLVIRHAKTSASATATAAKKLSSAGPQVLGIVVNNAKLSGLAYTDRYYYYSQYYSDETAKKPKGAAQTA